ncbi:hypothetical protein E2C01_072629 [Portunus trituberculatus]|uniref:Uncharacterized protein n=1 Tax=Portunus trituberculatus TaxID=210409 RepID=A0A5B7I9G3_PORTR|nr:hypothetical protein [Portunus trituberculatus]
MSASTRVAHPSRPALPRHTPSPPRSTCPAPPPRRLVEEGSEAKHDKNFLLQCFICQQSSYVSTAATNQRGSHPMIPDPRKPLSYSRHFNAPTERAGVVGWCPLSVSRHTTFRIRHLDLYPARLDLRHRPPSLPEAAREAVGRRAFGQTLRAHAGPRQAAARTLESCTADCHFVGPTGVYPPAGRKHLSV